jgi:acetylglutamate kinase
MPDPLNTVVVKIGGSTLGAHDTTLADVATLVDRGRRVVVIHGGGATITKWLDSHGARSEFIDGLRATDAAALEVVVAVLAGLINKQIVADLAAAGARALGLSGVDGRLLIAEQEDERLGFVGIVRRVNLHLLEALLGLDIVPVVAPIAAASDARAAQLLNVNADTVAGEVAAALGGSTLVFLTDVAGVLDERGSRLREVTRVTAQALQDAGVLHGGMLPKIGACLRAAEAGCRAIIVDGRQPHALAAALETREAGTVVR